MNTNFAHLLLGGDLRSIARSNEVVRRVTDQQTFDQLFTFLLHHERLLVMRAADAIEKITLKNNAYLAPHKPQLLALMKSALHKELKWHLALLVARLDLSPEEAQDIADTLDYWALNPNESKLVRVNSLQGLFELSGRYPALRESFFRVLRSLEHERIPSLVARVRKLKKEMRLV